MSDDPDVQHRAVYSPPAERVAYRAPEDVDDDEMMAVRLPIASTGEVRNQNDDPLTTDELRGMAEQVADLSTGVFEGHGTNPKIAGGRYSQFEKLGYWAAGEVETDATADGEDLLVATARMPDPKTLPAATGDYREGLAILKEQAKRGIPMDASIGWRTDDAYPGGNDLMEASIVGIGADPRTNTEQAAGEAGLLARAAVDAGADPEAFVTRVADAVAADTPPAIRDRRTDADRGLSATQADRALSVLADYRDAQGNGDVGNFESWLWNVGFTEYDEDTVHAAMTALEEFFRAMTPLDAPVTEDFRPYLTERADGSGETASDDDDSQDDETTTNTNMTDGQTRAPDDLTEDRLLTFTGAHFDGMDEGDLAEAVDAADAEFVGETDVEELYDLVSVVTGAEYDAVADAMAELMDAADGDEGEENEGDKPDDDDEDDDEDEERVAELEEKIDTLESGLQEAREKIRSGEFGDESTAPDPDEEQDADADGDGAEADGETDGDTDEQIRENDDPEPAGSAWLSQ